MGPFFWMGVVAVRLLGLGVFLFGLLCPPLLVAQDRVDRLSCWWALLGTSVLAAVVIKIVRRVGVHRTLLLASRQGQWTVVRQGSGSDTLNRLLATAEAGLGWLGTGTLFGTLIALVMAALDGQAGLVPAGLVLLWASMAVGNRSGSGCFFSVTSGTPR